MLCNPLVDGKGKYWAELFKTQRRAYKLQCKGKNLILASVIVTEQQIHTCTSKITPCNSIECFACRRTWLRLRLEQHLIIQAVLGRTVERCALGLDVEHYDGGEKEMSDDCRQRTCSFSRNGKDAMQLSDDLSFWSTSILSTV